MTGRPGSSCKGPDLIGGAEQREREREVDEKLKMFYLNSVCVCVRAPIQGVCHARSAF